MTATTIEDTKLGFSMAASWAWGVSLAVSFAILAERGITPFLIWATGNILAIALFGVFVRTVPNYLDFSTNRVVVLCMTVIQIFAIWINFKIMAAYTSVTIAAIISVLLFLCVFRWGFRFSVDSDMWQYAMMIGGLLLVIAFGTQTTSEYVSLTTTNIKWALFSALGLLAGPFLDAQQYQRAKAASSIKPFIIGSAAFGFYLSLVYAAYCYGVSTASAILLAVIVIAVATSTLDSCVASLQHITGTRLAVVISLGALVTWWLVDNSTVSEFWFMYATARIYIVVPLILIAVWMKKRGVNTHI